MLRRVQQPRGHQSATRSDEAAARGGRCSRRTRARDGFESVSAVPMRLRSEVIGALNLFSARSTALDHHDLAVAQAMADIATIGILQERAIHDSRAFSAQLEAALDSRIVIEQAKGIVAERNRVGVDEAFQQIRQFAAEPQPAAQRDRPSDHRRRAPDDHAHGPGAQGTRDRAQGRIRRLTIVVGAAPRVTGTARPFLHAAPRDSARRTPPGSPGRRASPPRAARGTRGHRCW